MRDRLRLTHPVAARLIAIAMATCSAAVAAPVLARPGPALNAASQEPAPGASDGLWTVSIRPGLEGRDRGPALGPVLSGLAAVSWGRRGLSFSSQAEGARRVQVIHGDLVLVDAGVAVDWGRLGLDVALPVALAVRDGGPNLIAVDPVHAPASGDLRLGARWRAASWHDASVGTADLGARLQWSAPTATAGAWLGSGGARFDLTGLVGWERRTAAGGLAWFADAELGLRLRPLANWQVDDVDAATGQVRRDSQGRPQRRTVLASGTRVIARLRAGLLTPWRGLGLAAEGQGLWDIDPDASDGQWLGEGALTAELPLQDGVWRVFAAVGGAVTGSWGSSATRATAGLRVRPDLLPADGDGDGLDDRLDRCPTDPEDRDGYQDGDGCPDRDDDGDGVADVADRCRMEPEDKDGHQDADGCPDADDDGDGIPDSADACPRPAAGAAPGSSAEDVDHFEDRDGCPDPDNDGDGVADVDDLCPDTRETINNHQDDDGCPDEPPPPLAAWAEGRLRLARPIRFEPGTARIDAASREIVAAVAAAIRADRGVRAVEVSVFTDDGGTAEERVAMTQARADAVKAALVGSSGLEAHQILAIGRGDAEPVASNADAWGRSRNRRVEIRALSAVPAEATAPAAKPQQAPGPRRPRRR